MAEFDVRNLVGGVQVGAAGPPGPVMIKRTGSLLSVELNRWYYALVAAAATIYIPTSFANANSGHLLLTVVTGTSRAVSSEAGVATFQDAAGNPVTTFTGPGTWALEFTNSDIVTVHKLF